MHYIRARLKSYCVQLMLPPNLPRAPEKYKHNPQPTHPYGEIKPCRTPYPHLERRIPGRRSRLLPHLPHRNPPLSRLDRRLHSRRHGESQGAPKLTHHVDQRAAERLVFRR